MAYAKMWFGTEDKMQWVDCPLQGADVSPVGWETSGTLLNGGGYASHSWATHRQFTFEWRSSSSKRMAQIMHNYRDGVYGRGLIYFVDPLTMDFNILPKQWAYPALMADELNNPFLRGTELSTVATPTNTFNLPVQGAVVPLGSLTGFRAADSVFVPRPEGKVLRLWGLYTITGDATAGVYAIPVLDDGTNGTPVRLTPTALNGGTPAEYNLTTGKGVRLCVMKTSAASGTVNLFGLVGRLANADGFRDYSWAGAPGQSASEDRDGNGTLVATNLAPNPSFEYPGAEVVVRTNLVTNPSFSTDLENWIRYWFPTLEWVRNDPNHYPGGNGNSMRVSKMDGHSAQGVYTMQTAFSAGTRLHGIYRIKALPRVTVIAGFKINEAGAASAATVPDDGEWHEIHVFRMLANDESVGLQINVMNSETFADGDVLFYLDSALMEISTNQELPYFDGSTSPDPDLTPRWTGTANASTSELVGVQPLGLVGVGGEYARRILSKQWADTGSRSLRIIPYTTSNDTYCPIGGDYGGLRLGMVPGQTYTVLGVCRLTSSQAGTLHSRARRLVFFSSPAGGPYTTIQSDQPPNEPGVYPVRLTFTVPPDATEAFIRAYNGATAGNGDVWWDSIAVVPGVYDGPFFDGDTPSTAPGSAPLTEWLGGQGNSGCRFVGSPTYIENNGVGGGQVSYAASFMEVGDWL